VNAGTFVTTFLASAVEAIEMVAIVIAVGVVRGWRSALIGASVALVLLLAVSVVFGAGLAAIPIRPLRLVIGTLLLIFGLQWLRKGVRRVAERGFAGIGEEEVPEGNETRWGLDWVSFVVSFKGVLLEGLEIAFIAVTFGAAANAMGTAVVGAVAAVVVIGVIGAAFHRTLMRIPRSVLILAVGIMLSTFGTVCAGEGLEVGWPGGEWALLALVGFYLVIGLSLIAGLRRRAPLLVPQEAS
jgi:uncharacterized membrane protein